MSNFHYLTRGVILKDGKVLVVKAIGADNTFLPGGHIEIGERAKDALKREIKEEINQDAIVKEHLGAIEHSWAENGTNNFEINLVFKVEVPKLSVLEPPVSCESHLQFIWLKPNELESHNLKPAPLIELIKNMSVNTKSFWGSTL